MRTSQQRALARLALLPIFGSTDAAALTRVLKEGGPPLEALIRAHRLEAVWHAASKAEVFRESRRQVVRTYLTQVGVLTQLDALFTHDALPYVVLKGVGARARLYDDPSVRPSTDIDLLVSPRRCTDAIRILTGAGFQLKLDPGVVSHEATLWRAGVTVDLHWDILRPGRTRIPMVEELLTGRRRDQGLWVLDDPDALFVMLVHAAISKHVISPMALQRVADIARAFEATSLDWPAVHRRLNGAGLKTAAWVMLTWVKMLTPPGFAPAMEAALESVCPGPLRRRYLERWLTHDWSPGAGERHTTRLLAFSLWLHDRPSDAWRAVRARRRSLASAESECRDLRLALR